MPKKPPDQKDRYEPTDLSALDARGDLNEAARQRLIAEEEQLETRRDLLLGQIARVRGKLYAAEAAGDAAKVAALRQTMAELTRQRDALTL